MRRKVTKLVPSEEVIKVRQMAKLLDEYTAELEQTNAEIEAVMKSLLQKELTPEQRDLLSSEANNFIKDCESYEGKLGRRR